MAPLAGRLCGAVRVHLPVQKHLAGIADRLGVRAGPVRRRAQLDRDGVHLPGCNATVARLGRRGAAVNLPRRLSRDRHRPCMAVRPRGPRRAGYGTGGRQGNHRVAPRDNVHRLSVEPCGGRPRLHPANQDCAIDRHLRTLRSGSPARRRDLAGVLQEVATTGRDRRDHGSFMGAPRLEGSVGPACRAQRADRSTEYRPGSEGWPRLQ